ncbi:hypothetical protein D3C85_1645460 [compost metagenome]
MLLGRIEKQTVEMRSIRKVLQQESRSSETSTQTAEIRGGSPCRVRVIVFGRNRCAGIVGLVPSVSAGGTHHRCRVFLMCFLISGSAQDSGRKREVL